VQGDMLQHSPACVRCFSTGCTSTYKHWYWPMEDAKISDQRQRPPEAPAGIACKREVVTVGM
jgi:hypothetical protein